MKSQVWGRGFHRGRRGHQQIALTFDDGPSRTTPRVLEILERHGIAATFFCCGINVERLPQVACDVRAAGHVIGNHSYSHPLLWRLTAEQVCQQLMRTQETIADTVGVRPHLFRPPFGVRVPALRKLLPDLGLTNVMWTVIGNDWKWDKPRIVKRVLDGSGDAGVICLHDGRRIDIGISCEQTVLALEEIIPRLKDRGFSFVTAAQMLEDLRGNCCSNCVQMILLTIIVALVAIGALSVVGTIFRKGALDLNPLAARDDLEEVVSIIVPMRNEERNVDRCLAGLRAQSYARLEVIAVDDCSSDRTSERLAAWANAWPELRLIRLGGNEERWASKSYALHRGVQIASGDSFVYLDADAALAPDAISRIVSTAHEHLSPVISVMGRPESSTLWEKAIVSCLLAWIVYFRIMRPDSVLLGAFIYIRRKWYRRIGGYGTLIQPIQTDTALARALSEYGVPARTYLGGMLIVSGCTRLFGKRGTVSLACSPASASINLCVWAGWFCSSGLAQFCLLFVSSLCSLLFRYMTGGPSGCLRPPALQRWLSLHSTRVC